MSRESHRPRRSDPSEVRLHKPYKYISAREAAANSASLKAPQAPQLLKRSGLHSRGYPRGHHCLDDAIALFLPVLPLRVLGPLVILGRELLPLGADFANVLLCGDLPVFKFPGLFNVALHHGLEIQKRRGRILCHHRFHGH